MQAEKFDLEKAKDLIKVYGRAPNQLFDYSDCITYFMKYFYALDTGDVLFFNDNNFKFYNSETVTKVYFKRLGKGAVEYFFEENLSIYELVCKINGPKIGPDFINTFGGFKHAKKDYATYSKIIKSKVNIMKDYIFEILSSGNQEHYDYLINWYANVCQGKRNKTILYLKGIEGIGKSTLSNFICEHVIGNKIVCKGDSSYLKPGSFNMELLGKIYCVFEELPVFSKYEWQGVASSLKDLTDGAKIKYNEKYVKSFESENLLNIVINTNVDALTHSEGRRIFIVDVSTKREKDSEYFGMLHKNCINDVVGGAFYNYLLSIDTSKFKPQNFPETTGKKDAIVNLLDTEYRFLKDNYILEKKSIEKVSCNDLYLEYQTYCELTNIRPLSLVLFCRKLRDIGIDHKKVDVWIEKKRTSRNVYSISIHELNKIASKRMWIHELDEYNEKAPNPIPEIETSEQYFLQSEKKDVNHNVKKNVKLYSNMIQLCEALVLASKSNDKEIRDIEELYNNFAKKKKVNNERRIEINSMIKSTMLDFN
jgi:hypothetical protein